MTELRPQRRLLTQWRVRLALAMLPGAATVPVLPLPVRWRLLLVGGWALTFAALWLVWLPLALRRRYCRVGEGWLQVCSGLLYRRERTIPLGSVQFTAVRRTLTDRLLGLSTLTVTVPGGRAALPGLLPAQAEQLARRLAGL